MDSDDPAHVAAWAQSRPDEPWSSLRSSQPVSNISKQLTSIPSLTKSRGVTASSSGRSLSSECPWDNTSLYGNTRYHCRLAGCANVSRSLDCFKVHLELFHSACHCPPGDNSKRDTQNFQRTCDICNRQFSSWEDWSACFADHCAVRINAEASTEGYHKEYIPLIGYDEIDDFGEIEEQVSKFSQMRHGNFPPMGRGPGDQLSRISLQETPENTSHVDKDLCPVAHPPFPPAFFSDQPEGILSGESIPNDDASSILAEEKCFDKDHEEVTRGCFTRGPHASDHEDSGPEASGRSGDDASDLEGGKQGSSPGVACSVCVGQPANVGKEPTSHVQGGSESESGYDSEEYSTCEETDVETSASFDDRELAASILDINRRRFIGRAMKKLSTLVNSSATPGFPIHAAACAGGESTRSTSASRPTPSTSKSSSRGQKRSGEEDDLSGSGKDDRPNKRQSRLPTPPRFQIDLAKFACPFFKRNPQKYATPVSRGSKACRACLGPGWDTVHRVKEHLYRRHLAPPRCPRCHKEFESDDEVTTHLNASQICERTTFDESEEVSRKQEQELRRKTRRGPKEEDKWREMFRILFPDDTVIPSPFYGILSKSDVIAHYDDYQSRRLGVMFRRMLEDAVEKESQKIIEEQMIGRMVNMVQDCKAKILKEYQQFPLFALIQEVAAVSEPTGGERHSVSVALSDLGGCRVSQGEHMFGDDPAPGLQNVSGGIQDYLVPDEQRPEDADPAIFGGDMPYLDSPVRAARSPGTLGDPGLSSGNGSDKSPSLRDLGYGVNDLPRELNMDVVVDTADDVTSIDSVIAEEDFLLEDRKLFHQNEFDSYLESYPPCFEN